MSGDRSPRQPVTWILWHPHQKLWNWRLVGIVTRLFRPVPVVGSSIVRLIVFVDSLLLLSKVTLRRRSRRRRAARRLSRAPRDVDVLYVDCGVHIDARELVWLQSWLSSRCKLRMLAFEAGREHYEQARQKLAGIPSLDLRHAALVGPSHDGPTAALHFTGGGDGRGASLFASRGQTVETVPAVRLSEVLRSVSPAPEAIILRMNIEGAESFVIDDLVQSGLHARVDGWYGMWDDLSKIDPQLDAPFRAVLKANRIETIPFNDRDLGHPIRRLAIRTDIEAMIGLAAARSNGSAADAAAVPQ